MAIKTRTEIKTKVERKSKTRRRNKTKRRKTIIKKMEGTMPLNPTILSALAPIIFTHEPSQTSSRKSAQSVKTSV